jgi:hypothetical protein
MSEKVLIVMALTLAITASASASGWDIAASYPAPAPNARSISFDTPGGYCVLCDGSPPRIYKLNEPSKYVNLGIPKGAWGLSAWSSRDTFTVSNYNTNHIYTLTTTGSVLSSFRCPKDHPADLSGGYYKRYVAIPEENVALELTTGGSVVSSFRGPGTRLTAINANFPTDGVVGDPATHRVYFLGFGTAALEAPVGAWADRKTDAEPPYTFVWIVDATTNYIYKFSGAPVPAVVPASFGRVKALFE